MLSSIRNSSSREGKGRGGYGMMLAHTVKHLSSPTSIPLHDFPILPILPFPFFVVLAQPHPIPLRSALPCCGVVWCDVMCCALLCLALLCSVLPFLALSCLALCRTYLALPYLLQSYPLLTYLLLRYAVLSCYTSVLFLLSCR